MLFKNLKYHVYNILPDGLMQETSAANFEDIELMSLWTKTAVAMEIPENCVCIDLNFGNDIKRITWKDELNWILKFLDAQNYVYYALRTKHGISLFFKQRMFDNQITVSKKEYACTLGFYPLEYKSAETHGETIIINEDEKCEWIKLPDPNEFNVDMLTELPIELCPMFSNVIRPKQSFWKLDTMQDKVIAKWSVDLRNSRFSSDDILNCCMIINDELLAKHIQAYELQEILKPVLNIKGAFDPKHEFSPKNNDTWHDDMAKYLWNILNAAIYQENIYIYDEIKNVYELAIGDTLKRYIIDLCPQYKKTQIAEVVERFCVHPKPQNITDVIDEGWVSFNNCLINPLGTICGHTPGIFSIRKVDCDYVENAYDKYVDDALNELLCSKDFGGEDAQRLIFEELMGCVLFDHRDTTKSALILKGVPNALKSKVLRSFAEAVGISNISSLSINEIKEGGDFKLIELVNKLVNIDEDFKGGRWTNENISMLKKCIGGSMPKTIRPIYSVPIKIDLHAKIWGATNDWPRPETFSDAVFGRFQTLWCGKACPDFWNDGKVLDNLTTPNAKKYWIKLAFDGWRRYVNNKQFTYSQVSYDKMKEWKRECSKTAQWLVEDDIKAAEIYNNAIDAMYADKFLVWMRQSGNYYPVGKARFIQEVGIYFEGKLVYSTEHKKFIWDRTEELAKKKQEEETEKILTTI